MNIVNLISHKIEGTEGLRFITHIFEKAYKVIQSMDLEDPLFVPSVTAWRKLFIRIKEIDRNNISVNTDGDSKETAKK